MAAKLDISLIAHYSIYDQTVEDPILKDLVFGFRQVGSAEKNILFHRTSMFCTTSHLPYQCLHIWIGRWSSLKPVEEQ